MQKAEAVLKFTHSPGRAAPIGQIYASSTSKEMAIRPARDLRSAMERGRLAVNSSAELSTGSTTGWRADRPEPGLGASRLLGIPEQIAWLSKQAHMLGYADIDDLFTKNPRQFDVLAKYWREKHQLARLH